MAARSGVDWANADPPRIAPHATPAANAESTFRRETDTRVWHDTIHIPNALSEAKDYSAKRREQMYSISRFRVQKQGPLVGR
jgi:hypothetical protein